MKPIIVVVDATDCQDPFLVEKKLREAGIPAVVWDSSATNIRVRSGTLEHVVDACAYKTHFRWTPPHS